VPQRVVRVEGDELDHAVRVQRTAAPPFTFEVGTAEERIS
jgi:hypothetical protein